MKNRQGRSGFFGIGAVILLIVVSACATRPASDPPTDPPPGTPEEAYTIGVQDVLRVSVWQQEGANVDVPVRPDGMITVPLIGDVQARGKTAQQLQQEIAKRLAKHVVSPDVTVIVLQMNSRFVSVVGRVQQTARVPMTQDLRIVEAIALAGGFDPFADTDNIRIVRRLPDGKEVEYRFDYEAYMEGKAPNTNFLLKSGDVIYVPD
jgi:polysaccharide export outer membrane protein